MRAQFLREVDGEAVFLKDGKLLTVPLERFAEADRQAMQKLAAGKPLSEEDNEDPFRAVSPPSPASPSAGTTPAPALGKRSTPIVNRTWTDSLNNRTTGKFVRVNGREVVILRGPRRVVVPFDSLSPVDQAYVNQILAENEQEPLSPLESASADGQPDLPPPQVTEPQSTSNNADNSGPSTPANSQFFRELRERQDEAREQQAEFAEANPDAGEAPADESAATEEAATAEPPAAQPAEANSRPPRETGTLITAEALRELRPVLIVGLVVLGLFGAVGIIAYFATSVAAGNSARRQRIP